MLGKIQTEIKYLIFNSLTVILVSETSMSDVCYHVVALIGLEATLGSFPHQPHLRQSGFHTVLVESSS